MPKVSRCPSSPKFPILKPRDYTMSEPASPRSPGPSIQDIVDVTVKAFGEKAETAPRPTGRPSDYTEDMATSICILLAEGVSLRQICDTDGYPYQSTVYNWLLKHEGFREKYEIARTMQQDTYVDETVHIADTEPDPAKARVRIYARQWHAGKLRPKKYGDRLDLNPDDDRPMNLATTAKDDTQRAKAMAALLARRRTSGV